MRPAIGPFKIKSNGKFYIGDLCYAMSDRVYDEVWGKMYKYEDGSFIDPETGLSFAMVGTAYGDGSYWGESTDGSSQEFPVDAGIIGICPIELTQEDDNKVFGKSTEYGIVIDYTGEVEIDRDETGTIHVTYGIFTMVIPTAGSFDDDDEDPYDLNW